MDVIGNLPLEPATGDEALSRTELQIEQEKLKLERERILLERERLESVRERVQAQEGLHTDQNGRLAVKLSTLILVSIICTLVGGILGALSTSTRRTCSGAGSATGPLIRVTSAPAAAASAARA